MGRILEKNISNEVIGLLERLIDKHTDSVQYAETMYALGYVFGASILSKLNGSSEKVVVACTAEDADNLGRGIIDVLEGNGRKVILTVFWNKRFNPGKRNDIAVAPIIREFHEESYVTVETMVVVKSIISSSCVVRTN